MASRKIWQGKIANRNTRRHDAKTKPLQHLGQLRIPTGKSIENANPLRPQEKNSRGTVGFYFSDGLEHEPTVQFKATLKRSCKH